MKGPKIEIVPAVRGAMRRPITVVVLVLALILGAFWAIKQMPRDILPNLNLPVIYVAQPYGGMTPAQMEGYLTYYYEYHFLYTTGIKSIESKNIQGTALIKLTFHNGTNMAGAMAEVVDYADRARAFMPPGTVPPFILRFDAGSLPIGDLVFSSKTRPLGVIADLALNRVRPLFATLPGVSSPPPFGASQRTIVIRMNEQAMRKYNVSPGDVAKAVTQGNVVIPAGNIYLGNNYPIVPLNSVVNNIQQLGDIPIRLGTYPTVFVRDVAKIEDGTDITVGYALINGRRSIYIPVTKRPDASTLAVAALVKKNLPNFQDVLPNDVKVSYAFDQTGYVKRAIGSLVFEGAMGALLTSLMVLLFLRDLKSAFIVTLNIPLALAFAVVVLWLTKQTVNIMTLGGLALAVGVLVDETTVTIENIHTHMGDGKSVARAALEGTSEIIIPKFMAMISILVVFIPSFLMKGVAGGLFIPLSIAVGFSMMGSYLLSNTFVPILSSWILTHKHHEFGSEGLTGFAWFREKYRHILKHLMPFRIPILIGYFAVAGLILLYAGMHLGLEIFPQVDNGEFTMILRAPTGTTFQKTEEYANQALNAIKQEVGPKNLAISVGIVGMQSPDYAINNIYLWSSGPQYAILDIGLRHGCNIPVVPLEEKLRKKFAKLFPNILFSFEPNDIISKVMSQGATKPIEVAAAGPYFTSDQKYGQEIKQVLSKIPYLRDLEIEQQFNYPTVSVDMSREQAGIRGLTVNQVGQTLADAAASSRYTIPAFWADLKSGIAYQVQVEVPQRHITSVKDIQKLPIPVKYSSSYAGVIPLNKFATVTSTVSVGEYDRYDMLRMVSVAANIYGADLGKVSREVKRAMATIAKDRPKGVTVFLRGQITPLQEMMDGFAFGLALSLIVIFLVLSANFQSIKLAVTVLSTVPAVLSGVAIALLLTHTTINIESFMGSIMSIGVAVANAILLVDFAERFRMEGMGAVHGAVDGAASRLRPILMTALAMLAGMVPMALGLSEGGSQTAPLGRAVIGGLSVATIATLFLLPMAFAVIQGKAALKSPSLDPDDPKSAQYDLGKVNSAHPAGEELSHAHHE